jgi:hypothetical protein
MRTRYNFMLQVHSLSLNAFYTSTLVIAWLSEGTHFVYLIPSLILFLLW